jgi:hypothetical protein
VRITISIAVAALVLAGWSKGSVIHVFNNSGVAVSNVAVSGNGFTNQLGTLGGGKSAVVTVQPAGESGVTLYFERNGKKFDSGSREYVEGGTDYQVELTIQPDMSASSGSGLRNPRDK